MKRYLIIFLKFAIPLAIVAWLLASIEREQLDQLRQRPKDWGRLAAAFGLALLAICVTFVRWYWLVRTIRLSFRLADAFRLGFLGYLLNFVSVGAVGGDLFRAFFIAREQPGRRAEAVATVVVDRVIGMYALLLVTSSAIFFGNLERPAPALAAICNATYVATAVGGVGILLMLLPGFTTGSLAEWLMGLPRIGAMLEQVISSLRMYRDRKLVMVGILALSMSVQSLFAVSLFMIATALFESTPSLGDHFIIVPLSMVAGALPFTPAGLGSFEIALDELYVLVPAAGPGEAPGILIALGYRIITIAIAAVGVVYYWMARRDVQTVLRAAAREAAPDDTTAASQADPTATQPK